MSHLTAAAGFAYTSRAKRLKPHGSMAELNKIQAPTDGWCFWHAVPGQVGEEEAAQPPTPGPAGCFAARLSSWLSAALPAWPAAAPPPALAAAAAMPAAAPAMARVRTTSSASPAGTPAATPAARGPPTSSQDVPVWEDTVVRDLYLSQARDMAIGDSGSGWRITVQEMRKWSPSMDQEDGVVLSEDSEDDRAAPLAAPSPAAPRPAMEVNEGSPHAAARGQPGHPTSESASCKIERKCPNLYAWVVARVGTHSTWWILALSVLHGATFMQVQYALVDTINPVSVLVLKGGLSLLVSLGLSVHQEGIGVLATLSIHYAWRWLIVAALFFAGEYLTWTALRTGLHEAIVQMIGYSYMPISALVSTAVFRRPYGRLSWLRCVLSFFTTLWRCTILD